MIKEFTQFKLNLRQGLVSTGMRDLQTKMLTVAEAKKRKIEIVTGQKAEAVGTDRAAKGDRV